MLNVMVDIFVLLVVRPFFFFKSLGCDHMFFEEGDSKAYHIYQCEKCHSVMVIYNNTERK